MTVLERLPDREAIGARAAELIAAALGQALSSRGVAHLGLSGGGTPRRAYELLPALLSDWSGVELWYGDERMVGPEDPESTHRLVVESLLAGIEAQGSRPPVEHRVRGEAPTGEEAAAEYDALVRARVAADGSGMPVLDVNVIGIGEDGHFASLFPGRPEVSIVDAVCVAVHDSPKPPPDRVTLTVPVLQAARMSLMLVSGAGKAGALAAALRGPDPALPASLMLGERLTVIADAAAAPPDGLAEA
jgi:6-phosphogluconolactonase